LEEVLNEAWGKEPAGLKYRYPQQHWLHLRAVENLVPFESLTEADILLWLRSKLESNPGGPFSMLSWFPVTVGSFHEYDWRVDSFPIFLRAGSRRFFDQFKVVLGVDSKEDFHERWKRALSESRELKGSQEFWERVFNVQGLALT
jgi:hypothetical protein